MKDILRPAVSLLEKIRYSYKLVLLGGLLAVPFCLSSYFLVSYLNGEIAKEEWRLLGIRTIFPIEQLAKAVHEHAGEFVAGGQGHSEDDAAEIIETIDGIDRDFGMQLGTRDNWRVVKSGWKNLLANPAHLAEHSKLNGLIDGLLVQVGEASGLARESGSRYLAESVIYDLPPVIDHLGNVMSISALAAERKRFSAEDRSELSELSGKIRDDELLFEANLAKAFKFTPDLMLASSIAENRKAMESSLHEAESASVHFQDARAIYERGENALEKTYRLSHEALSILDREESQRIFRLQLKRDLVFGAVFLAAAASLYFLFAFSSLLIEQMRRLIAGTQLAAQGADVRVEIRGRDEMALIADGMNDMIVALKTAEREKRENETESRYRAMVEQAEDAILLTEPGGNIIDANRSAENLLGFSRAEFLKMQLPVFLPGSEPDDTNHQKRQEFRLVRKDGSEIHVDVSGTMIHYGERKAQLAILRDITQRRMIEDQLHLVAKVIENAAESIMITDGDENIIATNGAFTHMTGYLAVDVLGRKPSLLKSGRHSNEFYDEMWHALNSNGRWQGEIWDRKKDGSEFPAWLSISVVADQDGHVRNYVSIFSDISTIKASQEKIEFQANYDALTGIPNRNFFDARLKQSMAHAGRTGETFGLMFIDLDNFKPINDKLGHDCGDMLLQHVAVRLKDCIREEDTVARLGGDEFAMILNAYDVESLSHTAERVLEKLAQPFDLGGKVASIGASIGIAVFPVDGEDKNSLLKSADTAMYQAKQSGKNAYRFYCILD